MLCWSLAVFVSFYQFFCWRHDSRVKFIFIAINKFQVNKNVDSCWNSVLIFAVSCKSAALSSLPAFFQHFKNDRKIGQSKKWSRYGQIFMYLRTLFALEKLDWYLTRQPRRCAFKRRRVSTIQMNGLIVYTLPFVTLGTTMIKTNLFCVLCTMSADQGPHHVRT
jgi:hypothetical protein